MWTPVRLGDIVKFVRGLTYAKKDEVEVDGTAVLRATNIDLSTHGLVLDEIRYINQAVTVKEDKYAKSGDLLICTASGSKKHLGKVALIEEDLGMAFGGFMAALRCNEECLPRYLYHVLTSPRFKHHLASLGDGANINNLKFSQIENYTIKLPKLAEQQRIVSKLDAVFTETDRAIESVAEQLESIDSVFNQYLANVTAPMASLDDIINIKTGKLNANAMEENGKYPFFTCSREVYAINTFSFDCDAVLLAGNNAAGDFNVKHYKGKFNAYQRTYVLTVKNTSKLLSRYLYFQLINALQQFKAMSVGAGTKFLKIGMIKELKIPVPTIEKQKEILLARISHEGIKESG